MGGDAQHNAAALRDVLSGAKGAYRDTVLLNASAALVVAGLAENLAEGARLAAAAIDKGEATDRLERLVAASNA
jgi:anthranilate phosphoribosyltransferase